MKDFFKSVRKHIGKLDAEHLREQYASLADEAEFFDRVLNSIDRGILVVEPNGALHLANPCAKELLGMEPKDAIAALEIPCGTAAKRELCLTYPTARTLEMSTLPMTNGDTLVLLRDVTAEREHTEAQLRAGATEAVRDLASGVAHEIGNPLNAISINLQLLERDYPGETVIADCRSQIARLDAILRGFLQALRPSKPNLRPGSVADPLKNCLATLKGQFEERRILVTLDMPGALPAVAIDSAQLEQVYFNLLKNALEAMKDGDSIKITVSSDDNDVTVTFADTGMGMSAEQIVHLFEPYRTSKAFGTGLGLMISKRIVRDHGGTIDVASTVAVGTTFTVRLPRLERRIRRLK